MHTAMQNSDRCRKVGRERSSTHHGQMVSSVKLTVDSYMMSIGGLPALCLGVIKEYEVEPNERIGRGYFGVRSARGVGRLG